MTFNSPYSIVSFLKVIILTLLLSFYNVSAQQKINTNTLAVGENVPELKGITWLQGEAVSNLNEQGKIYMLELWATWCGPCIAEIPHINNLHKKYTEKGLVIIGLNVFEENIETPKKFLEKQGDGMSYRVAFSGGSNSNFANDWLKPAGLYGIPHALIIKSGKVLYSGHPSRLQNTVIESMLDGTYDAVAEAKKQKEREKRDLALSNEIMPLFQSKDWDGIMKVAEKLEDDNPAKLQLQLTAISEKGDWTKLLSIRNELSKIENPPISIADLDKNAALGMESGAGSKEYALICLSKPVSLATNASAEEKLYHALMYSRLYFFAGNMKNAKSELAVAKSHLNKIENVQIRDQLSPLFIAAENAMAKETFPRLRNLLQSQ